MSGATSGGPGETLYGDGDLVLNDGRDAIEMDVTNTGDRAVQVGSHFHFFEANRALAFDRASTFGYRLDIPSGTAVRFEAGQTTSTMPGVLRIVAEWNPVTTLSDAARILFGNPNTPPMPGDPWSIAHPIAYTVIWIVGIIVVCAPLAVRSYEKSLEK